MLLVYLLSSITAMAVAKATRICRAPSGKAASWAIFGDYDGLFVCFFHSILHCFLVKQAKTPKTEGFCRIKRHSANNFFNTFLS